MNTELIIIFVLIVYTGFLHFLLFRKNQLIESLLRSKTTLEDLIAKEGVDEFIRRVKKIEPSVSPQKTKFFEQDSQQFILENEDNQVVFIHYTKDENTAKQICNEGFRFSESFHKTAESITGDKLDLTYKHYLRKSFGRYVVVIAISKQIYDYYIKTITQTNKILNVEQLLSQDISSESDDSDETYILPKQYIKGYINTDTAQTFFNNDFNPNYNPPYVKQNLDNIKG
ncbi:MAG: hypothetical protein ACLFNU_01460 [Bacteroidales bacterium]